MEICRKYGMDCTDQQPLAVADVLGVSVYADQKLNHNRPDITLVLKDTQKWKFIDTAVRVDQNVIITIAGNIEGYREGGFDLKRIQRELKVMVVLQ